MIVAVEILPQTTTLAFSHLGDQIEDSIVLKTPKNQRALSPLIIENIKKTAGNHVEGIGLVTTGQVDGSKQKLISLPSLNYKNLKIVSPLAKLFNCPVALYRSAEAGAIAEAKLYKKTRLTFVQVDTYSTSTALVLKNSSTDINSYSIDLGGHIVGYEPPNLQTFDSFLYELFSDNTIATQTLNNLSANEFKLVAEHLAVGVYNIICLCNPTHIMIGRVLRDYYKKLHKPLNNRLRSMGVNTKNVVINKSHYPNSPLQGAMQIISSL